MKWIKNAFVLLVIITAICSYVTANAAETQTKKVVKVAFPETRGMCETYADGTRGGIIYEWLVEIAKYTGWEYDFIEDPLDQSIKYMDQGKYDLMGAVLKTPGFGEKLYYPEHLMGYSYSLLIYNKNDQNIKGFDIKSLEGKTIGVFEKAFDKIKRLNNVLEFNGIKCNLKYYSTSNDFESSLDNDEVDLLLVSDLFNRCDDYNIALRFNSEPCYIVSRKDDLETSVRLNDAIKWIYDVNPNFGESLFQKYFPVNYRNTATFSEQEHAFVQKNGPFRVAVTKKNYPFYYVKNGEAKGIVPEMFDLISAQSGAKFEYVIADSYGQTLEMVRNGNADIIGYYINEDEAVNIDGLNITKNYMMLNSIIMRNKYVSFPNNDNIAAVLDGSCASRNIRHKSVVNFDTYEDCLNAVEEGVADYTRVPVTVLEEIYMRGYFTNVIPVVDSPKIYLALGVNAADDIQLYSILNKSLVNLTQEQTTQILANNTFMTGNKEMSFKALVYSNPVIFSLIITVFILLVVTIIYVFFWFKMKNQIIYLKMKKVENISKVRSEFLSRMSHEIRTPLNAIIGLANLMRLSGDGDPVTQKNISKIDSSAKFLLSIVNDILDMSKIESGKIQLESRPFSVENLLEQLRNIFQVMAEERNINLQFKGYFTHKNFVGDELRLKQILINLLSNAHKFTETKGEITVTVLESSVSENSSALRFSVCDTGIGIPEADLERIFGSFEQVFRKSRSNQQGTGLGLAISRNLVELMGGILSVRSEVAKGSEFFFTIELPVYQGQLEECLKNNEVAGKYHVLQGKNVLLAEDNDLNAEIAVTMLEMQGVKVERVVNGQQAVDRFKETLPGTYDLILMDLQMPIKDGLEAAVEIRALERADARGIPIIAMTANTMQEDREKALSAGMNCFIPKPFDVEQLYQSIEKFLN